MSEHTILLIDSDADLRHATARALERAGFIVVAGAGRDQAFRLYLLEQPCAVVLSVDSPDDEGIVLCRQLRALPGAEHLVILLLAGEVGDEAMLERSFAAGATDCLARPVNYVMLRHRLRQLLEAQANGVALARSRRSLAAAQRAASLGDWRLDVQQGEVSWSPEVSRLLRLPVGRPRAAPVQAFLDFVHPEDRPFVGEAMARARDEDTPFSFEARVVRADHAVRTVRLSGHREVPAPGGGGELCGSLQDITDRRSRQEQLRYLAWYDQVTRLPNRARLEDAILRLASPGTGTAADRGFALVCLGLDNHHRATESLGRGSVDELLRMIASRLESAVRSRRREGRCGARRAGGARPRHRDLVARIGGYEFAVLAEDVADAGTAEGIGRRLCERLAEPYLLDGHRIYLTASAGVAVWPGDAPSADALLRAADTALADAGRNGGGRCERFAPRMSDTVRMRSGRELALRNALEQNRFLLHYQPRVDLSANRVMGAEALLRMQDEDGALIPPGEFIPLAEELGLIVDLGRMVITRALRQLRDWQTLGLVDRHFVMSVNISPRQFADPRLFEHIETSLRNERVPPNCLELEITEGTLVSDLELTSRLLAVRRELGIRVAIDDYGTGYSSLAYLRGLPIDTLKIDRCFIDGLGRNQTDEVIVRFTIQLAHHLNLKVCAEGVECQTQLDYLRAQRCDQVQGYHFGRPMAAEALTARLVPPSARDLGHGKGGGSLDGRRRVRVPVADVREAADGGHVGERAAPVSGCPDGDGAAAGVAPGDVVALETGAPQDVEATGDAQPIVLRTHDQSGVHSDGERLPSLGAARGGNGQGKRIGKPDRG